MIDKYTIQILYDINKINGLDEFSLSSDYKI